jgi:mono/diheme cytochrome c family protein
MRMQSRHLALVLLSTGGLWTGCGKQPAEYLPPVEMMTANKKQGMTWYKDVQLVMQKHCQSCHAPGGIGPFSLMTYAEAKAQHMLVSAAVVAKRMPPWLPADTCQPVKGTRRLSQDEIDTVFSWSADGAPEGNPADAPPPPGDTNLTLSMPDRDLLLDAPYTPTTLDDYRCFVLDPMLATTQDLTALEFVPGVRSEVHHVIIYSATAAAAQAKLGAGTSYACYGGSGISAAQMIGGWVPGSGATFYPTNTGIPITAGHKLVMQIHYNTQQGAQPDRSRLKLKFAQGRVARPGTYVLLNQQNFTIPSGATNHQASISFTAPNNGTLWGVLPHMHTLGKQIKLTSLAVGGTEQCVMDIPRWDFHWQQLFMFDAPNGLGVVAGTKFTLNCTWDNPTGQAVSFGEGTSDEMCLNYSYVTP